MQAISPTHSMTTIKSFEFNPFNENTYVLSDESSECIIIDPGCHNPEERDILTNYITQENLKVVKLINTHCHIDHVFGNTFIKSNYGVELIIHPLDEPTLEAVEVYAPVYGFNNFEPSKADQYIEEGDLINFGNSELEVLFAPGHAPGHVVFVNKAENFCIGGDVLFRESIGRTDLPGGDHETLIHNIQTKMFELDDLVVVYPGHGPTTTIGHEKAHNPFCAIKSN